MTRPYAPHDVAMLMSHVVNCQCRYTYMAGGEETKLVDVRCIAAYVVPDDEDD